MCAANRQENEHQPELDVTFFTGAARRQALHAEDRDAARWPVS
jgi:hypothetical protein